MMKQLKYLTIGLFCCFLTASCGRNFNKRISIGLVSGWPEGQAMTLVTKEALTRAGYHVVIQKAATSLILASMNKGGTDAFMDVWLPKTHGKKVDRFTEIHRAGTNYEGALIGLVVPTYVTIDSITQLNANRDKFSARIVGIERGSGIARATDKAVKAYNLDYTHLTSSTVAMVSELKKAIGEKRWIVVTGWQPHWIFERFDLKFLKDPKNVYGDAEHIDTYVREGLQKDFPTVYRYFQNFYFDDDMMAKLLSGMQESENKQKVAEQWVDNHIELLNSWFGKPLLK